MSELDEGIIEIARDAGIQGATLTLCLFEKIIDSIVVCSSRVFLSGGS